MRSLSPAARSVSVKGDLGVLQKTKGGPATATSTRVNNKELAQFKGKRPGLGTESDSGGTGETSACHSLLTTSLQ